MKTHPGDTLSLALLDGEEPQRTVLRTRLRQLGHACSVFSSASELILALSGGQRFQLLLAVPSDEASLGGLPAACQVLGRPVLVVVPDGQWRHLSLQGKGFESSGTLGADVSRMADAELDWLVRALVQRKNTAAGMARPHGATVWGNYHFYEGSRHVQFNGQEMRLQPRQFVLALQLFRHVGRVVEREWLWKVLWRVPVLVEGKRALDACVSNVRKRLELNGEHGFLLRAVYGQGYQLIEVHAHGALPAGIAAEQAAAPASPTH
jgi:DNA-binding winged helix-turn-helix (wHTH) protein